ncbi:protein kinase [Aspergillus sclerotioniger CBS 115572]|uniref:Protein kinase n=1 Tax=Aspergillus sclerotioniger CBS 115572 TaxID=1450535 RepID=A0A317XDA3_9EURO|nr:protein kinase [Aspergillus sclerotioniger CBS 115572]PWY96141.1 protein kinase [Aspergillus sclerotioniger CBS 115572]
MPSASVPLSSEASVEFKSYSEETDCSAEGNPEPIVRSQTLIYRWNESQWWIKVRFQGDVYSLLDEPRVGPRTTRRERREEFRTFVRLIDYRRLPPLNDTVTELVLDEIVRGHASRLVMHANEESNHNHFVKIAAKLKWAVQEDPSRVVYPTYDEFPSFHAIDLNELSDQTEIADGVFRVLNVNNNTPYILKVVNRPLYYPHDTKVIRNELENIEIIRNVPGIVQAAGVAVSTNPYKTSSTSDQPPVIVGIVLEYYSGGSLKTLLKEHCLLDFAWERWALQIATALACFHMAGKTHLDIKPANIVIDADGNAVLIDISGIGGYTHGWRAPEILGEVQPSELPFAVRRSNDTWAYGKVLLELVLHAGDSPFVRALRQISGDLMIEDMHERMTLLEAIPKLACCSVKSHSLCK